MLKRVCVNRVVARVLELSQISANAYHHVGAEERSTCRGNF